MGGETDIRGDTFLGEGGGRLDLEKAAPTHI